VSCNPANDPTCPPAGRKQDGPAQFIGSWSNPRSIDFASVRFGHVGNDKLRLFFRFSDTGSSSANQGTSTDSNRGTTTDRTISPYTTRTYTAGATSALMNRLTNEFRSLQEYDRATESLHREAGLYCQEKETETCDHGWFGGTRR
jgi:hypothetical protein